MAVQETFANDASTTVSAGGTTAPAGGTSETWTVASSSSFPAATTGSTQFHVADPALPSELIAVTNVSGTTWTVTRGAENTTPVAHTAGFTIYQVVSAGGFGAFMQANVQAAGGDLSGTLPGPTVAQVNGVAVTATPAAGGLLVASSTTAAAWAQPYQADTTAHTVTATTQTQLSSAYNTLANKAQAGTIYRLTAGGTGTEATGTAVNANVNVQLGGVNLAGAGTTITAAQLAAAGAGFQWRLQVEVVVATTGSSGTVNAAVSGQFFSNNGAITTTFANFQTGRAFNSTIGNALQITWFWASSAGSPTVTCSQTIFEALNTLA